MKRSRRRWRRSAADCELGLERHVQGRPGCLRQAPGLIHPFHSYRSLRVSRGRGRSRRCARPRQSVHPPWLDVASSRGRRSGRAGAARFGGGDWPTSGTEWGPAGPPPPLRGDEWRLSWVGAAGVAWRVVATATVPPAQGGKGAAVGLSAGAGRPGSGEAARSATRAALLAASRDAAVPLGAAAP